MRLVFAGTPEVALPSLDALVASDHEVVAVVTRPDAPAGRGRRLEPSPVRVRAGEHGLPVLAPASVRDAGFLDELRRLRPDACPVVAYGNLVPPDALEIPPHGWVNLHFSLLPAWRGAAPVQHAILAGDEVTGASTFRLEAGLDTGPVFGVLTESIRPCDTAGDLLGRLAGAGAGLLVATLDGIEAGRLVAQPQPAEGVSHAPKLTTEDARVRWEHPALSVDRRVRACTPSPGAWTTFRGQRLGIGPVAVVPADELAGALGDATWPGDAAWPGDATGLAAGRLACTKHAVFVGTGSTPVRLGTVRPHGRRAMPAEDWARGVRIEPGEKVGDE
ncbi:MAG TPA: methionyl-tRNA formyltransferase [Intrasporangium sp.]|uniref:methionyl-tRNA formyltransferase n=1 Tax=Intrasporangium sp. TaxID=1925024 RepID=UPI002D768886|nr:methionyl-tRNA formyltransferase [Intrasporangium sp.]HET7399477.1 methionyl-tRNA formyltransferase [Intrasporangium sp.]